MELVYFGANCVRIKDKKTGLSVVVDDNLAQLGLKKITKESDIALFTGSHKGDSGASFVIDGPGEYEKAEAAITGIAAQSHIDKEGQNSTIYGLYFATVSIGILGHIDPNLSDDQLEELGVIDILIIPIGGNGYTLDGHAAAQLIKRIEPKVVIPTHFADSNTKYEVPQQDIGQFLEIMGASETEQVEVFKVKDLDSIDSKTKVVVLKRTS